MRKMTGNKLIPMSLMRGSIEYNFIENPDAEQSVQNLIQFLRKQSNHKNQRRQSTAMKGTKC